MSDSDITLDRRTVLKRASIAAAGGVFASAGSATAMVTSEELQGMKAAQDCNCTTETKCVEQFCQESPHFYTDGTTYERECCECDGETVCEDTWTDTGTCCPIYEG